MRTFLPAPRSRPIRLALALPLARRPRTAIAKQHRRLPSPRPDSGAATSDSRRPIAGAIPARPVRGLEDEPSIEPVRRDPPPGIPFHVSNFGPRRPRTPSKPTTDCPRDCVPRVVFGSTGTTLRPDTSREPATARPWRCADCGSCSRPEVERAGRDLPNSEPQRSAHDLAVPIACPRSRACVVSRESPCSGSAESARAVSPDKLRRGAILALLAVGSQSGCTREFYREWANQDASEAVFEKSRDPRWRIDMFSIEPPAMSRFADPYDPEFPPAPPDDPAAEALSPVPQWPDNRLIVPAEGTG